MTEPRSLTRHPHRFAIRLEGHLPVFTEDVSEGGFAAVMLQPLSQGQLLSGTITLGEWTVPFEGRVAWVDTRAPIRHLGRFGFRFSALPEDFRLHLASYQRSWGRRLPRWSTNAAA